CQQCHSLPLTF
nr:immunoglobulin light chain junction region [Macaca mulatta]